MSIVYSQQFKNNILTEGSVKAAFDGSLLSVYSGPLPDFQYGEIYEPSESNTLLITYSSNGATGAGLLLSDVVSDEGLLLKHPDYGWVGTTITEGIGTFFQITRPDQFLIIMQGTCGTIESNADLKLDSTTFTLNTAYAISYFALGL